MDAAALTTSQPQAFIDAGDVSWPELEPLLRLRLAGLLPGDVLEVQAGSMPILDVLLVWCDQPGRTLLHREPSDGVIRFWIGKAE